MRFKLICLCSGFVCGYLMIEWMPQVTPFIFVNFITDFIFNPLRSFLAMVCFLFGFLANAVLIRSALEQTIYLLKGRKIRIVELFICYAVAGSFYILFQRNVWLASLFLIFSLFYGMMSIDFQRNRVHKNDL